jgi:competence protein ComEA
VIGRGWMVLVALLGSVAARAEVAAPRATAAASAPHATGVVNLNEATADELERLPNIGPVKARSIVEFRHAHRFLKVDEITRVKGIGRKTFGKLRPYITVVGPTTLAERPSRR